MRNRVPQDIDARFHTVINEDKLAQEPASVRYDVEIAEEAIAARRAKMSEIESQIRTLPLDSAACDTLQAQYADHRNMIARLWPKVAPFQK